MKETVPVKTIWRQVQAKSEGPCDSIRVTLYELDSYMGKKPPLYFNRC